MALYRLPFDGDPSWKLATGNWDDPTHGHDFQMYAYDFVHQIGGNVLAARAGTVINLANDVFINTWSLPKGDERIGKFGAGNFVWIRHADETVGVYMHFSPGAVAAEKGQWVPQGHKLGLSGNTGHSSAPHLHFEVILFAVESGAAGSGLKGGPPLLIHFEDKNHVSWRPRVGEIIESNNFFPRQDEWRWCSRCQGLFYAGHPGSQCPQGGAHVKTGSGNYALVNNPPFVLGQGGWRWCHRCQSLFRDGSAGSKCFDEAPHSPLSSGNYVLDLDSPLAQGQPGWRRCKKCQSLFFGGNMGSICYDKGTHSKAAGENYNLAVTTVEDFQKGWRWCHRCQGLFFIENPGSKCPDGEEHTNSGDDYFLIQNSPDAPGQPDWRWCHKCQGLFFGGVPSKGTVGGTCPADSKAHSQSGSGNYTLVSNSKKGPGQPGWRWCHKCQGLFFGGVASKGNVGGKCPADHAAHSKSGSGDYRVPQ